MKIENNKLIADEGKKIIKKDGTETDGVKVIYLASSDSADNYKEIDDFEIVTPPQPQENTDLAYNKRRKIYMSKVNLADYLENNPLYSNCHGGEYRYYSVTEEKQNMFTSKYMAHQLLVAAGLPDVMTWNYTGGACEPWTEEECIQFIAEVNAYVVPLVANQQHMEIDILAAKTLEELNEINIEFGGGNVE